MKNDFAAEKLKASDIGMPLPCDVIVRAEAASLPSTTASAQG